MALLFGAAMATVLLGLLAADAVWHEVRHTRRSLAYLAWEAAGSTAAALAVNILLLRAFELWARVVLFFLIAAFLFLAAAYLTVESWRRAKIRRFDAPMQDLRRRLGEAQEAFDRLTWEIQRLEREKRVEPRAQADPEENWRRIVQGWESAPGLARIRSLKTHEWREEARALDDLKLEARRRELAGELAAARDPARRDQVEAQLAIVELERVRRRSPRESQAAEAAESPLEAAKRRRDELEQEVRRIQVELRELMRQREAVLRERVVLD